jgi:hypothetical protein
MMTVRRSKKWNVINVIYVQKWCSLFSKACHYVALFQEFVDTLLNGRRSLFRIDGDQTHDILRSKRVFGPLRLNQASNIIY